MALLVAQMPTDQTGNGAMKRFPVNGDESFLRGDQCIPWPEDGQNIWSPLMRFRDTRIEGCFA
ncbi:hypothetical protein B1R45_29245 [Pseudomonas azotoformans]|nr:hypothetical protein B1R45_29245 [Pseudomonas azotoformans]